MEVLQLNGHPVLSFAEIGGGLKTSPSLNSILSREQFLRSFDSLY
jgi:hypothetical protein